MKIKNQLVALVQISLIISGVGFSSSSHADPCAANTSPTADCSNLVVNASTNSITNNYSLSDVTGITFNVTGSGVVLSNFTNNGTINIGSTYATQVASGTAISSFNNTGSILGGSQSAIRIVATGEITTLNNSGTIRSTTTNALVNASGAGTVGTIGTLINSGSIVSNSGQYGFLNNGSVGTITNFALGAVTGSAHTGFGGGADGIDNNGTITTLNSAQNDLFYRGKLPSNLRSNLLYIASKSNIRGNEFWNLFRICHHH
jgi:hypothetical protein